jgi:inner membrane protein involved in colicin E2 resistance
MRGIQDNVVIVFNEAVYKAKPGLKTTDLAAAGVSILIKPLQPNETNSFSFELNLNGSEQVSFIPVGESNTVKIKSMRLAKYSIIFLVFTFATFFFSEIINNQRIHSIHYILIGMAILIFYIL